MLKIVRQTFSKKFLARFLQGRFFWSLFMVVIQSSAPSLWSAASQKERESRMQALSLVQGSGIIISQDRE